MKIKRSALRFVKKIVPGMLFILALVALPLTSFGLSDEFNKGYDDAMAGRPSSGTSQDYIDGYEEGMTDYIGGEIVADDAKDGRLGDRSSDDQGRQ